MTGNPLSEGDDPDDAVGDSDVKLTVGSVACVWNHYLCRWTGGFAVAEVVPGGYRLRRLSDGHVFRDVFRTNEVMAERRRSQRLSYGVVQLDRRKSHTGE